MGVLLWKNGADSIKNGELDFIKNFSGNPLLLIQMLTHVMGLILPAALLTINRKSISHYIGTLNFNGKTILNSILLLAFSLPLINLVTYINLQIPLPDFLSQQEKDLEEVLKSFLSMNGFFDLLLRILVIGLVPAIGEEWIFRGIIQNQLIRLFNHTWTGIIIGAIIFSAIHMQFQGFLPRFTLGIILGYVYLRSNSLIQPVLLHCLFNSVQVVMVYFLGVDQIDNQLGEDQDWKQIGLSFIISIPFLYWQIKFWEKTNKNQIY